MAGALGVPANKVEVAIAKEGVKLPKLPALELCGGSAPSVNGLPFARLEDQNTVPIVVPSGAIHSFTRAAQGRRRSKPEGIASVYGPAGSPRGGEAPLRRR